jgi:hypothetical protein
MTLSVETTVSRMVNGWLICSVAVMPTACKVPVCIGNVSLPNGEVRRSSGDNCAIRNDSY